jgi:hypothetical protein
MTCVDSFDRDDVECGGLKGMTKSAWVHEAIHDLVTGDPAHPQSAPLEPVRIERNGQGFYDLEFCFWLQANFDSIVAQIPQWKEEYERNHASD